MSTIAKELSVGQQHRIDNTNHAIGLIGLLGSIDTRNRLGRDPILLIFQDYLAVLQSSQSACRFTPLSFPANGESAKSESAIIVTAVTNVSLD